MSWLRRDSRAPKQKKVQPLPEGAVVEALLSLFQREDYRPPMPPAIALKIHELARKENFQMEEVVELLESDPMLAADVLKRSRSPVYGANRPKDLLQAVNRLGMTRLTQLVWEVSMTGRVFRAPEFAEEMERVRDHSVAVAHATRLVTTQTNLPEDEAFIIGLTHDMGLVATLVALSEARPRLAVDLKLIPHQDALREIHDEAGGIIARLWRLPSNVEMSITHFHNRSLDLEGLPLLAAARIGEWLVEEQGVGAGLIDNASSIDLDEAMGVLRLNESHLFVIRELVAETLQELELTSDAPAVERVG